MATLVDFVKAKGALKLGDLGDAVTLAQLGLRQFGHEIQADGDFGEKTEIAVRAFQAAHGIKISGRIGLDTANAIEGELPAQIKKAAVAVPAPSVKALAPWLSVMRAITGEKEYPGAPNSPFVLGMAATIGQRFPSLAAYCREYRQDLIPWCGLTEAYVMAMAGIRPVTKEDGADYGFLWAGDWAFFGEPVRFESEAIPLGAVMVLTRRGGGHVTTFDGWVRQGDTFAGRGGNQSDMIKVSTFGMDRVSAVRWPKGYPRVFGAGNTAGASASMKEV